MDWLRWTKKQLRLYMSRDLYRQDIKNELSAMDDDIAPRVSHLDGMPKRSGGLPFSSVEHEAEYREEARERLLNQLKGVNIQIEQIENALDTLSNDERRALELAYMSTFHNTDKDIASHLKTSLRGFWRLKISALHKVYVTLKGVPYTIDLEEWIKREERKHKRSLRLKEEDQADKMEKRKRTLGMIGEKKWTPKAIEERMALLKKLDERIAKDAMKRMKAT